MMMQSLTKLAQEVGSILTNHQLKLVTAESCTGGGLGYWLTSVSGSSAWYERGYITYSNQAKMTCLNVETSLLETYGAVSEETARAMAVGALAQSDAQFSLSITGIAGPEGGTIDKPVGTVWIAASYLGETKTQLLQLPGNREAIRHASIKKAMTFIIATIINDKGEPA